MEWLILAVTFLGSWAALAAYRASQQKDVQDKKSRLLDLHGRNVVEMERLLIDLDAFAREHGVMEDHFMQGLTYAQSIQMLRDSQVKLMETKRVIMDHGEKMPPAELEANIQRLSDNLNQFDFIRNRLPGYRL